jgi:hypothetical protein
VSVAARGVDSAQGARDTGLNRGWAAQLVFAPFLMGISEVGTAPGRPSGPSTAAAGTNGGSARGARGWLVLAIWNAERETAASATAAWLS